jgi:hypothetical protein
MTNTTNRCHLCGAESAPGHLAHGANAAICRSCVSAGLVVALKGTAGVADGQSLPRSFSECSLCALPTPRAALYQPREAAASACSKCLTEACALLTQTAELGGRRRLVVGAGADEYVGALLERHFEGLDSADVVTTSRTFPS